MFACQSIRRMPSVGLSVRTALLSQIPQSRALTSGRSFRVLGIQQVAIGGLDKKALSAFWVDTLGVKQVGTYRAEKENVDEDILQLGEGVHAVEIDIMQVRAQTCAYI